MTPSPDDRGAIFKIFARALFMPDLEALYVVVTPDFVWSYHDGASVTKVLTDRSAIAAHIAENKRIYSAQRFNDVAYHHLPDVSFMTCRISETLRATGEAREQRGIERYTFKDGRIAIKDVYRKPI
jgi:ketosteroid isomerase-like protein